MPNFIVMKKESRAHAKKRARKLGFKQAQVVKSKKGGYFIAPRAATSTKAKKAYAGCRASGGEKAVCSAIAINLQKKSKK